jgi:hypothetical protein
MISVGIDVSKEKSTVCILKPYGEIVAKPFEVRHTDHDLGRWFKGSMMKSKW